MDPTQDTALQESSKSNMESRSVSPLRSTPSFLARKAHRFSSLKKKKPSTSTLLRTLFCHSLKTEGEETVEFENNSDCASLIFAEAADSLQLDGEAAVRRTIQTSIMDAHQSFLETVCSPTCGDENKPSPPTVPKQDLEDDGILIDDKDGEDDDNLLNPNSPKAVMASPPRISTPSLGIPTPFHGNFPSTLEVEEDKRDQPPSEDASSWEDALPEHLTSFRDKSEQSTALIPNVSAKSPKNELRSPKSATSSEIIEPTVLLSTVTTLDAVGEKFVSRDSHRPRSPTYSWAQVQQQIDLAVAKAKDVWVSSELTRLQAENNAKLETAITECRSHAEQTLQEHSEQWKEEHEMELDMLKTKYESKIAELKDQVLSSKQLAKQRQVEISNLEEQLAPLRDSNQIQALNDKVKILQQERDDAYARLAMEQDALILLQESSKQELDSVRNECAKQVARSQGELHAGLAGKQHEIDSQLETVARLQNELEQSRNVISEKQGELDKLQGDLSMCQIELEKNKEELEECRKELEGCRKDLDDSKHTNAFSTPSPSRAGAPSSQQTRHEAAALRREIDNLKRENEKLDYQYKREIESLQEQLSKTPGSPTRRNVRSPPLRTSPSWPSPARKGKDPSTIVLRREIDALRKESEDQAKTLRNELVAIQNEKDKLEQECKNTLALEREKNETKVVALRIELETVRDLLSSKEQELADYKMQEVAKLTSQVHELQLAKDCQINEARQELAVLREKLDSVKTEQQNDALLGENSAIAELRQQVHSLTKEREHSIQARSKELEEHADVLQQKEAEIYELKRHVHTIEASLARKEAELSKSRSPVRSSQQQETLVKARQDLGELRREMDQLKTEKQKEISSLSRQLKLVEDKLADKERELADLQKALLSPSKNKSGSSHAGHRESVQLHEREKEVLRHQIEVLEEQVAKLSREHEKSIEELRRASEQELAVIKREMETRIEKHMRTERELKETLASVDSADKEELLEKIELLEAEKKADRSCGLREVQKKEELLHRIAMLEKKEKELAYEQEFALQKVRAESEAEIRALRKQIEKQRIESKEKERELQQAISATESFEKEDLLRKVDKLEAMLESERNGTVLVKMKVANLEKEAKRVEAEHREEMEEMQTKFEAEIKRLQRDLAELAAIEDAMQITTNEKDLLQEELDRLKTEAEQERRHYLNEMDRLRLEHSQELTRVQNESFERLRTVERSAQIRIDELEKDLLELKSGSKLSEQEERQLRSDLEATKAHITALQKSLDEQARDFDSRMEEEKRQQEERIKSIQSAQARESEEVLSQLDMVETEHKSKLDSLKKTAEEKDAIIAALGSQLAAAQARSKGNDESQKALTKELEETRAKASQTESEIESLRIELDKLREIHKNFVQEANADKEKACADAREEMITRAEAQFAQANDLYCKLKKQYDLCKKKVENIEKELKRSKDELKKAKERLQRNESKEVELKAEVAELKAENAKVEADAARKAKEYRREMERLLRGAEGFEKRLRESEAAERLANKKVSALTAEKAKIQKEHDEIKSMCEELMAMVEGQQHEC